MVQFARIPLLAQTPDYPAFHVDCSEFAPYQAPAAPSTLTEKIKKFSTSLFSSIAKSLVLNFSNLGTSFKYTVLGFYGSNFVWLPSNFYLIIFKIIFWAFEVGLCVITTSFRLFLENYRDKASEALTLSHFAEAEINTRHIQTKAIALDASQVPADVTIDNLLTIYDEINFHDENSPGYMKESSRAEGRNPYTIAELRESLGTNAEKSFIKNVKGRVAFLGTPPQEDIPRLLAFYQQIEDAVRLSIHKSNEQLRDFKAINGNNVAQYTEGVLKQYSNILEDRARIAIDLAIAGKHCGTRFMGESMSLHSSFYGGVVDSNLNLQDHLIEILAQKRKDVAAAQAQIHFGADVHGYSNYMASLGQILAIPGTENIVEHISYALDPDEYLPSFFAEYTVEDCIIPTIQEAIKNPKGSVLREKITNWIQTEAREWNKEAFSEKEAELMTQIQAIINAQNEQELSAEKDLATLDALIKHLQDKRIDLPKEDSWEDFIQELFRLDETKNWRDTTYSLLDILPRATEINRLKLSLSEDGLGNEAVSYIWSQLAQNQPINMALLRPHLLEREKASQIQQKFQGKGLPAPEGATIQRLIKREIDLAATLKDHLDLLRGQALLAALNPDNMVAQGLSPTLLEWLLVSQGILKPQLERGVS